jgi:hypothetical protein
MTNEEIREQIQENIIAYIDSKAFLHQEQFKDDLCQIVVDCFAEDKKKENNADRYYYHPEEVFNREWFERNNSKL